MDIPLDEVIHFDAISSSSTGAAADADSTPTFAVYEESTDTDIGVGGNMTKRTSLTGNYRGSFTASAANGFELGKWYNVIGSATIGSVACKGVLMRFRIVAAEATAGYPVVTHKVGTGTGEINLSSGKAPATIAAGDLATDSITAAALKADAATEIADAVWASASRTLTAATNITAAIATAVWAEGTRTLTAATNITAGIATAVWSESVRVLTAATNLNIPSAATIAAAVWDYLTSAATTVGSLGKLLVDNVNATISSRSSHSASDVWAVGTRTLTAATNITSGIASAVWSESVRVLTAATNLSIPSASDVATAVWAAGTRTLTSFGTLASDVWAVAVRVLTAPTNLLIPTAGEVADAVWDESTSGHQANGSTGKALTDAGSGGGGGGTTIFAPVLTQLESRIKPFSCTLYVGDVAPVSLAVYSWSASTNSYTPTDLTTFDAMTLFIEDGRRGEVQTVTGAESGIDGSDNNLLEFTPSAATVGTERTLQAALRKDSNGQVIAHGELTIKYLPS